MNVNGKRQRDDFDPASPNHIVSDPQASSSISIPSFSLTSESVQFQAATTSHASASTSNPRPTAKKKPALHPNPDQGCPLCPGRPAPAASKASLDHVHYTLESWIGCSKCKIWYHTSCTQEDPEDFIRWYCKPCIQESQFVAASSINTLDLKGKRKQVKPLENVPKPPQRKSGRKREKIDYQRVQEGLPPDPVGRWKRLFQDRTFGRDSFKRMYPQDWSLEWLLTDPTAMESPVMIPSEERRERERLEQEEERELQERKGAQKAAKKQRVGRDKWYETDDEDDEEEEETKRASATVQSQREEQLRNEVNSGAESSENQAPDASHTHSNTIIKLDFSTDLLQSQPPTEEPTLENSIQTSNPVLISSSVSSTTSIPLNTSTSEQELPRSYSYQDFALAIASSATFAQSQSVLQSPSASVPIQSLPHFEPQPINGRAHPLLEPYINSPPHSRQHDSNNAQHLHQAHYSFHPGASSPASNDPYFKPFQFPERPKHVPPTFEQLEALSSSIHPVDASQAHPSSSSSADVVRDRPLHPRKMKIPGMTMPPEDMTIREVALLVGEHTPVEVIDVATQSSSKSWTLGSWATYFSTPSHLKRKILNVISLEVTNTPMEHLVEAPELVRSLCWVTRDWPGDKRDKEAKIHTWPKVQRYCLMGVEGAYTDFHIDFCASAVYYHVMWGQKTFLLAPPTQQNLKAYKAWSSSTRQDLDWLGDNLDQLTRVDVLPGDTLLIASGWIHAVYTAKDTLVLGGNWISDWSISRQWRVAEIEKETKVPKKFRFPHIERLSWYVANGWLRRFADQERARALEKVRRYQRVEIPIFPPERVLRGLLLLCDRLDSELSIIKDDGVAPKQIAPAMANENSREVDVAQIDKSKERLKRMAREAIPPEIGRVGAYHPSSREPESGEVGGAEGVARELRERVENRLDELVPGWRDVKTESKRGRKATRDA